MIDDLDSALVWLRELQARAWSEKRTTRYKYLVEESIGRQDKNTLCDVLAAHRNRLLFLPGSGTFGFGVSMSVNVHIPAVYPGVLDQIEHVLTVTDKQLFPDSTGKDKAYRFIESYTHTEENKRALQDAGIKEPLQRMSYYDY